MGMWRVRSNEKRVLLINISLQKKLEKKKKSIWLERGSGVEEAKNILEHLHKPSQSRRGPARPEAPETGQGACWYPLVPGDVHLFMCEGRLVSDFARDKPCYLGSQSLGVLHSSEYGV